MILLFAKTSNSQEAFWAKSVSGNDYEYGVATDLDSHGNLFIIGYSTGPTVEIDSTSYNANGDGDAFIAKFSPGHQLLWFKTLGGDDAVYYDSGMDIHVDDNDNVIILVTSAGHNFTYNGQVLAGITSPGQYSGEGVIIKVDNDGNYLWHDHGSISSSFQNVASDAQGNIFLTGWFAGTITLGDSITMTNTTSGTTKDMFVAKYLANGQLVWAKHVGGTVHNSFVYGHNIAFNRTSGKLVVMGRFERDAYFDTGVLSSTASYATYLVAYDTNGTELWKTSLFNNGYSYCQGLGISSVGLIGVVGYSSLGSNPDGLLGFYDLNGAVQTEEIYSSNYCRLHSIAFNSSDECFITGTFNDTVILGVSPDTIMLTGFYNGFLLKLDNNLVANWAKKVSATFENEVTCKDYRILYAGRIDGPYIYNYDSDSITNNHGDAIFAEFSNGCYVSDTTTSLTDTTITANNIHATYQWLDCGNNYAIVPDATTQTFTPGYNGLYAVQLTEHNCVDTTNCQAITHIGIIENDFGNKFTLYPNPSLADFYIDLGEIYNTVTVNLTDLNGKIVRSETFTNKQLLHLNLEVSQGIYLLKIGTGDKKAVVRLVKL